MKFFGLFFTILAALAILGSSGCGGGGGTSGGTTATNGGIGGFRNIHVEAFSTTQPNTYVDPKLLVPGDEVELRLMGQDDGGTFSSIPVDSWNVSNPSRGSLAGSVLTVLDVGTFSVSTTFSGKNFSASARAIATGPRVSGRVKMGSNNGIGGVTVRFYNAGGTQVATATSEATGYFMAAVPTTATRFSADFTPVITEFFNQFAYGSLDYSFAIANCRAALPTLNPDAISTLPNPISGYERTSPPPPPPTGCLLG